MATAAQWLEGARPRTLPMAVAPVVAGTAAAFEADQGAWLAAGPVPAWARALLALIVSVLLQVGVNYANDYSDGIRGTDDVRVGPLRLTGSGAAEPAAVKRAAFACFGVAGLAGTVLALSSGLWWLILVGIVCVLAAWGYTGGSRPYGYMGLGDVMVFVFFGLVATLGTAVTQVGSLSGPAWVAAVSIGLFAMALLMANNVRDIPTDREVGKRTLAVRLGDSRARAAFAAQCAVGCLLPVLLVGRLGLWALLPVLAGALAVGPVRSMLRAGTLERAQLIPVLKTTGILTLVFSLLFAAAVVGSALTRAS
ncbi:1,4-dihydroxy-2-naphthoate polyprenyltransferase [Falsarthrobacter nasiphocae]|uniref:1,4-dihydroxy-2-naphthoate octaprenyltransferase n=1 Tax=Falsarthrobacter nasiphocae TaxID=189863 RepID=A0AAE3YFC9_9MICC|nr:1,4-dihydroxy-2-naphthoate polyprenyltransferase [Falsarthrobacter nasiphocae]MDR6892379.1 1,4-dihydroxy-2-naphthoate octaprenyltransferase [Falsarthrobacter nasiphocae]